MAIGIQRLYFHQGTINQGNGKGPLTSPSIADLLIAYFNWWSDNQINVPFYGGFFAALALAGGDHLVASDPGTDSYAQYVVYKNGRPFKAVLLNTDYYSGTGNRNSSTFTMTGLRGSKSLKSLRFTAPSSEFYASPEQKNPALGPTIGGMLTKLSEAGSIQSRFCLILEETDMLTRSNVGQYFSDNNCAIRGYQRYETTQQTKGNARFTLKASEALLVLL